MGAGTRGVVVVTGASTGIGRATALHLDRLGYRVHAGVRRESDGEALRQAGSQRLVTVRLDVTDICSIEAAARAVSAVSGKAGLQGLVNNAGICIAGAIEFLPPEELRNQFEVNVIGQVAVTQAFLPLIRQGRGRIINMGSVGGRLSMPLMGAYCASKAALEAVTDTLRVELQPWKIRVSLIEPGIISTSMFERVRRRSDSLLERIPEEARRLYDPTIEAMRAVTQEEFRLASRPEVVARVVEKALTARRPKAHYLVGRNGRLEALVASLPDRLRDVVLTRALRLPRKQ
jgi:NAD(P)-dependent dehydrogenase (short-subunit alcohol dehydrogenase family)